MTSRTRPWTAALVVLLVAALAAVLVVVLRTDSGEAAAQGESSVPGSQTPSERPPSDPATPSDPVTPSASASGERGPAAGTATGPGDAGPPVEPHPDESAPDVSLHWDGHTSGALTVSGALWGEVVIVPGDASGGTVTVRNDGPTHGTLTASIVNAAALRDPSHPSWVDDAFYDDLTINGVAASTLEGARTPIHETRLAPGEVAEIPLTYAFDGWTGNRTGGGLERSSRVIVNPDGVGPRAFSFDVHLRIVGDAPQHDADDGGTVAGAVAHTGGAALAASAPWLLRAAGLVVVAAAAARALRRRPSRQRPESRP